MPIQNLDGIKTVEQNIEGWFQKHFGNVTPGTEWHTVLHTAKRDLRSLFGLPPEAVKAPVAPSNQKSEE